MAYSFSFADEEELLIGEWFLSWSHEFKDDCVWSSFSNNMYGTVKNNNILTFSVSRASSTTLGALDKNFKWGLFISKY